VELVCVVAADVPRVIRADQMRLRQIITNLVGNAVKFTEKGGVTLHVSLVMGQERHFLRFEVRDTGVGVPPEKRETIFEEFVQADSSHARKFGGTGLGLAISKRLAEAMGGDIGVDADQPVAALGGSCFWFTLPAIVVEAAPANRPLAGLNVAVMSPNRLLSQAMAAQIREAGGEVVGAEASLGARVDALLIDGGTGPEPQPIVEPEDGVPAFLLAAPSARARLDGLEARGFAGYLLKPVRQSALEERLACLRVETSLPEQALPEEAPAAQEPDLPPLIVPLPAAQAAPAPRPEMHAAPEPRPAQSQTGLTILLAEDNPINMMLIRELLRRRGHNVVEVTNGNDAVSAMRERQFDLLLTDIHMPGMDGIEAARAIRRDEAAEGRPRAPIVALTADAMETGKRACQDAGMDGFLTKPVDPAELEEMFLMLFPSEDGPLIVAA
jgi:CheY-like chemotaxis protein